MSHRAENPDIYKQHILKHNGLVYVSHDVEVSHFKCDRCDLQASCIAYTSSGCPAIKDGQVWMEIFKIDELKKVITDEN